MNIRRFQQLKIIASLIKTFADPDEAAEFIGVDLHDLTETSLKKAYRKMALELHPDINKHPESESQFKSLQNAYEYLLGYLSNPYFDEFSDMSEEEIEREHKAAERYEKELEEFEKVRPSLDKLSLIDFLKYYAMVKPYLEPILYYQFDRIDGASDQELVDVIMSWKELYNLNRGRMLSDDSLLKEQIVNRMIKNKFSQEQWKKLPHEIKIELSERAAEKRHTLIELEAEDI